MCPRPVTVGVDGSPESVMALDLAAAQARRLGTRLRVVHADNWAAHPALVDTDPSGTLAEELARRPGQVLRQALDRVAATGLPVAGEVVAGSPGRVLLHESAGATLLVVGHHRRGGPAPGLLLGSVALRVANHAACPVLVAGGRPDPGGDVVVGVGACGHDEEAMEFAFEQAALRETDLVALHAWHGPATPVDDLLPAAYRPSRLISEQARVLASALEGWPAKYPQVFVRRRLVHGRADQALADASRFAQLVVVGPGRHGGAGMTLRPVAHALLHHAECPVAVAHGGG